MLVVDNTRTVAAALGGPVSVLLDQETNGCVNIGALRASLWMRR